MGRSSPRMLALAAIGMGFTGAIFTGAGVRIATPPLPEPPRPARLHHRKLLVKPKKKRLGGKERLVAGQAGLGPHPAHWPKSKRPTGAALAQAINEWETARDLTALTRGW